MDSFSRRQVEEEDSFSTCCFRTRTSNNKKEHRTISRGHSKANVGTAQHSIVNQTGEGIRCGWDGTTLVWCYITTDSMLLLLLLLLQERERFYNHPIISNRIRLKSISQQQQYYNRPSSSSSSIPIEK